MSRAIFLFMITIGLLPSMVLARGQATAPAAANGAGTPPVDENKKQAEALYRDGQAAFDNGDYEKAAGIFKAAYKLDPNPLLMYNIARVYESADKIEEAIAAWKAYVELTDPRATSKVHALKRVVELQATLASASQPASQPASVPSAPPTPAPTCVIVLKDIPTDAVAKLNGKEVNATSPIRTDCLQQAVQIWRGAEQIGGGRVAMSQNKETVWVYEPNTPPITDAKAEATAQSEPPLLTRKQWGWIAAGTGAAALIGGSTLGILAKSEGPNATTPSAQDSVRSKMLGANILFGTSLLAGGIGAYLLIWGGDDDSPHAAIAPGPSGMVLTGTF